MSGEGSDQTFQIFFRNLRRKLDAGEAGRGQKLREATLRRTCVDGCAIQQKLRAARAEQQARLVTDGYRFVQLIPGRLKLFGGARMVEAVEPRIFQKDVEAANKCAGRCQLGIGGIFSVCGVHISLLQAPHGASTHLGTQLPVDQRGVTLI